MPAAVVAFPGHRPDGFEDIRGGVEFVSLELRQFRERLLRCGYDAFFKSAAHHIRLHGRQGGLVYERCSVELPYRNELLFVEEVRFFIDRIAQNTFFPLISRG